jgi:hypothetical protein
VREPLQELGRTAFLEARGPVYDQVLLEARRLELGAFDRERNLRVAPDVAELLLPGVQMAGDDLVAVEPDPDAADLRRAVGAERDEMGQGVRLEDRSRFG